jgi:hypothetical protein
MPLAEIDTLDAAVMSALRTARDVGTWDCHWWDYAPPGWQRRVKNAPPKLVEEIGQYVATERPHVLFSLVAEVGRLMRLDEDFGVALIAIHWRENTPMCLAEVFAHFENARRDAQ